MAENSAELWISQYLILRVAKNSEMGKPWATFYFVWEMSLIKLFEQFVDKKVDERKEKQ